MQNKPPKTEPKLLDQVRGKIRLKHYSIRTEQAYVDWIKRFILHFDKRHPSELGAAEVEFFDASCCAGAGCGCHPESSEECAAVPLQGSVGDGIALAG